MSKTKEEVCEQIISLLLESGLNFDDQVKAISMARVGIQPRASQGNWREKAKIIERPSGGIMGTGKRAPVKKSED